MRSIDLGKKFLGLALCFALSSSVVLANTLSEVQINADEASGYDGGMWSAEFPQIRYQESA